MEASLRNVSYPCCQTVLSKTYSLSENQECVVSDTLPDIAEILYTSASPLIRSKDVSDGRARLEANAPARVTCVGEEGTVFCIDVNIPFYLSAQEECISEDADCVAGLTLRQVEARMMNPRKISVRAELEVQLELYLPGEIETALAPEEDGAGLHCLEQSAEISCVDAVTEKTFVLTDEYTLPEQSPAAAEILAQSAAVSLREVKTVGSKLIASGVVSSELLYRCAEGELHAAAFQTEFSQIIEADGETEYAAVELQMLVSGMYYEIVPGTDQRELAMELHLVAQAILSRNVSISYLADAYSNTVPIELHRETRCFSRIVKDGELRETGRALLETPEPVERVAACRAEPVGAESDGGEVILRFRVAVCCVGAGRICVISRTLSQRLAWEQGGADAVRLRGAAIPEITAVPAAGGVELRYTAAVWARASERRELDCIAAIDVDESRSVDTDGLPTLVLLRPDGSRSLWELAKENCSTVEAIRAANGPGEGADDRAKLLVIPKAL